MQTPDQGCRCFDYEQVFGDLGKLLAMYDETTVVHDSHKRRSAIYRLRMTSKHFVYVYATMAALGLCLSKQEKWEEAEQIFAQAQSAQAKLYGSDSLVTVSTHY